MVLLCMAAMGDEEEVGREEEEGGSEMEGRRRLALGELQAKVYPSPLLSHEEVTENSAAFMDTLRSFHRAMGTRFMIPVIGGKDLELHLLYVEVTNRGGLERVILERKWREVIAAFNFPPTTTSASFVLRKYYLSLLHHYEQVYFFRVQGPLVPPSATLQTKTPQCKIDHVQAVSDSTMSRKRAFPFPPLPSQVVQSLPFNRNGPASSGPVPLRSVLGGTRPVPVAHSIPSNIGGNGHIGSGSVPINSTSAESMPAAGPYNFTVTGTIDGKFEHGYFVTVKIGSQILHGVLYHVHPLAATYSSLYQASHQPPGPFPCPVVPSPMSNAVVPYIPPTRSVRRRKRYKNRDPSHPKPNRSAYNFFFAAKHSKLKVLHPHREREYSKMIGESWNKLTEEERRVYDDYGRRDKERYRKELQEYRERINLLQQREVMRAGDVAREPVKTKEVVKEVVTAMEVVRAGPSEVKDEG